MLVVKAKLAKPRLCLLKRFKKCKISRSHALVCYLSFFLTKARAIPIVPRVARRLGLDSIKPKGKS